MKENTPQSYWHDALMAFGRMSGWVVGPIIVALFAGKWIDRKFGTEPYFFIGLTAVAFLLSMYGLTKEGMKYKKSVEKENKEKSNGGNQPHNN